MSSTSDSKNTMSAVSSGTPTAPPTVSAVSHNSTSSSSSSDNRNEYYLGVTQDGVVRLRASSPREMIGCYTEGLQTCLAIFFIGKNGLTMIHATTQLSIESIKEECRLLGEISCWGYAYNSSNESHKQEGWVPWVGKVRDSIMQLVPEGAVRLTIKAPKGFISVKLKGEYDVLTKPSSIRFPLTKKLLKDLPPILEDYKDLRSVVNIIDNFFLGDDDTIEPDLQYDGTKFFDIPVFSRTEAEIEKLIDTYSKFTSTFERWSWAKSVLETYKQIVSDGELYEKIPSISPSTLNLSGSISDNPHALLSANRSSENASSSSTSASPAPSIKPS